MADDAILRVARGGGGGPTRHERGRPEASQPYTAAAARGESVPLGAVWSDTAVNAPPAMAAPQPQPQREILGEDGKVYEQATDDAFGGRWEALRKQRQKWLDDDPYYRFARAIDGLTCHLLPDKVFNETTVTMSEKNAERAEELRNTMLLKKFEATMAMGMGMISDLQQRPGNMRFAAAPPTGGAAAGGGGGGGGGRGQRIAVGGEANVNLYDDTGSLYRYTSEQAGVPVDAATFMKELRDLSDVFTAPPVDIEGNLSRAAKTEIEVATRAAAVASWGTQPINTLTVRFGPMLQAAIDVVVLTVNQMYDAGNQTLDADDLVKCKNKDNQTLFRSMVANEILLNASVQSMDGKKFDKRELKLRKIGYESQFRSLNNLKSKFSVARSGIASFASYSSRANNYY